MKRILSDLSLWIFTLIAAVIIIAKVSQPLNQPIACDT